MHSQARAWERLSKHMQYFTKIFIKIPYLIIIFCAITGCSGENDIDNGKAGVEYINNGQFDLAIKALTKVIKKAPSDAEAHFNLARAYKRKEMDRKAESQFAIAFGIGPEKFNDFVIKYNEETDYHLDDTQHLIELGKAYIEKGMLNEAIPTYKKIIKSETDNENAHYSLGTIYSKKGMYDDAIGEFKRTIELNNKNLEAHYNLGLVYYRQGLYEIAISEYKTALELFHGTKGRRKAGVHYKLALAYYDSKLFNDAIKELNKALKITPNAPKIHYKLGMAFKEAGMHKEAERKLKLYKKPKKHM